MQQRSSIAVVVTLCWSLAPCLTQATANSQGPEQAKSQSPPAAGLPSHKLEKIVFVRADITFGPIHSGSAAVVGPNALPQMRRNQIAVMNSDGSGLTNLNVYGSDPTFSPDGTKIAFCSARDTPYAQIYVMNADGSGPQQLTHINAGDACSPAWSPDGRKIAFSAFRFSHPSRDPAVYIMDADGSNLKLLIEHASSPSWSPDGSKIAFTSKQDANFDIYFTDAVGTNVKRLTDHKGENSAPAWSPDGTIIAFVSDRDGHHAIYFMDPDGSNLRRFVYSKRQEFCFPAWSHDSSTIAFTTVNITEAQMLVLGEERPKCEVWTGQYEIFSIGLEGSGLRLLTPVKERGIRPSFGPVTIQR